MTDWPTWLALAFGGVGSFAAARSLIIQGNEHKRLTAELAKRADFATTIRLDRVQSTEAGSESATYLTPATTSNLPFAIGIKNTGDRAATHVTVNFLAPDRQASLVWTGPNGEPMPDKPPAANTSEELSEAPGAPMTRYLTWEFARVAVRTPRMVYAVVAVDVPVNGEIDFPVRVRVQSDDLPDDVAERLKDYVVHVRNGPGLPPLSPQEPA